MKILLLSQNKENINVISKILKGPEFVLEVLQIFDRVDSNLEDVKLIILDICNLDFEKDSYYANFFKKISNLEKIKFLLLNANQAESFLSLKIKFDDILFSDRLEEELFLRIQFVLAPVKIITPKNSIIVDQLILNLDKYELTVSGLSIELTFKEYELLKILLENPNKVFSRNKLLSVVWGYDFYGGSRTVDVHMRRLRSKLDTPYNLMLKTVRNVGYMFSPVKLLSIP
ncbi:MAG: response regulator transcription factor, partial [Actinobacteria bacterium]|nr:response regulator transcription factor [Actinomycetota bacterium]